MVWYTSLALTSSEKVAKLFETAYPGVKVEVHRTGSQRILQRMMQELQANIKNVDVVHTSDAGHYVLLKEKKLLMRYTPAGVGRVRGRLQGQGRLPLRAARHRQRHRLQHQGRLAPRRRPRTWKDLLDPKWRGRWSPRTPATAGSSPPTCSRSCTCTAGTTSRPLAQNKPMLVQSAVDPSGVVASGERPVAVNGGDYTFYQVKKKGNPVEIVYPKEGVPLVVSPSAITSFAPHPNAARLFTDFIFTREIQQVLADTEGLYSGHPQVTYPTDKPRLSDLKVLPVEPEELEKRNEEIKTRFVEFFGA